jgi:hypothetical protein
VLPIIFFVLNLAFVFFDDTGDALAQQHPLLKVMTAFGLALIETAILRYAMQRNRRLAQFFEPLDRL